jgi:hypothetical protein
MTKKERYESQLDALQMEQRQLLMKRDYIKASKLNTKIDTLKQRIKECDAYETGRLCDMLPKEEIKRLNLVNKMLKISLASDFLVDCTIDYADTLKSIGLNEITLTNMVQPIREQAQKLANMPVQAQYGELVDLMMENDKLIDNMHEIADAYLRENLDELKNEEVHNE